MAEPEQVSAAIAECMGSYLSRDNEQAILERFGPEVLARVRAVYDDVMDCPGVDWRTFSMDDALALLREYVPAKYPWLSPAASSHLFWCYVMAWK